MLDVSLTRVDLEVLLARVVDGDRTPLIKESSDESESATVYLTKRNIQTLLTKLKRIESEMQYAGMIVKNDTKHKEFPCTDRTCVYAAIEGEEPPPSVNIHIIPVKDEDYYTDREPGPVNPWNLPS